MRVKNRTKNPAPFQYDSVAWAQMKAHDLRQPGVLTEPRSRPQLKDLDWEIAGGSDCPKGES